MSVRLQKIPHRGAQPALAKTVNDPDARRVGKKGIVEELINQRHRLINAHADELQLALRRGPSGRVLPPRGFALRKHLRGPAGWDLALGVLRALNKVPSETDSLSAGINLDIRGGDRGDHASPPERRGFNEVALRERSDDRRVTRAGRAIELHRREYALLVYLALRRGQLVTRVEIEDHLYDEQRFPNSNVVASAISALRARLAVAGRPDLVQTRRGLGYILEESSA